MLHAPTYKHHHVYYLTFIIFDDPLYKYIYVSTISTQARLDSCYMYNGLIFFGLWGMNLSILTSAKISINIKKAGNIHIIKARLTRNY